MPITKENENLEKVHIAAGCLIEKDNKFLLVQEKKKKARGLWNLPAGKVEKGFSFEETARREAEEETGYKVKLIKKLGVFHLSVEDSVKHSFLAKIVGGKLNYPKDEILDAHWFSYGEIRKMKDKLRHPWVIESIEIYLKE